MGQNVLARTAGAVSFAAGLVHVVVALQHLEFAVDLGAFGVTAVLQIAWGAWLILSPTTPRRSLLWSGAGLQLICCGAWAMSRLSGLPFGSHAWQAQSVGLLDASVVGVQVVAAALAIGAAVGVQIGRGLAIGLASVVLAATAGSVGAGLALDGGHADHGHDHADDHDDGHDHNDAHDHEH